MDAISRTLSLALISYVAVKTSSPAVLTMATLAALVAVVVARVNGTVALVAGAAPVAPILLSYFVIEPMLADRTTTTAGVDDAMVAWLRVSGLALWSLAWLASLTIRDAAILARVTLLGQFALVPLLVGASLIDVTRERWIVIREMRSLFRTGKLHRRRRTELRAIPSMALGLILASLVSSRELAVASSGRGIGTRRTIPMHWTGPTAAGIVSVCVLAVLAWDATATHVIIPQ